MSPEGFHAHLLPEWLSFAALHQCCHVVFVAGGQPASRFSQFLTLAIWLAPRTAQFCWSVCLPPATRPQNCFTPLLCSQANLLTVFLLISGLLPFYVCVWTRLLFAYFLFLLWCLPCVSCPALWSLPCCVSPCLSLSHLYSPNLILSSLAVLVLALVSRIGCGGHIAHQKDTF